MRQLKIAAVLIVAIALQSALRAVWQPLAYVDLTLVLVVHFALQREPLNALFVAAAAGLTLGATRGRVVEKREKDVRSDWNCKLKIGKMQIELVLAGPSNSLSTKNKVQSTKHKVQKQAT